MQHITEATFWLALAKIIWVNILLSGDNAVVIALAAPSAVMLPAEWRFARMATHPNITAFRLPAL